MKVNYRVLDKLEFYEKGFFLSEKDDRDGGVISYAKRYPSDRQLIVTFQPYGYDATLSAEIIDKASMISSISMEGVESINFQAWHDEQILRVYLKDCFSQFLIYHDPSPKIFYGELNKRV